jgi:hypothetical protein
MSSLLASQKPFFDARIMSKQPTKKSAEQPQLSSVEIRDHADEVRAHPHFCEITTHSLIGKSVNAQPAATCGRPAATRP